MASFHFSNDVPPSTLDNLQRLSQFTVPLITSFTSLMLEFLATSNAAGLIDALKGFSGTHGVGIAVLRNLAQAYLALLKSAFQNNLSSTQLAEDLTHLEWPPESVTAVCRLWKTKKLSLSTSSLGNTLMVNKLILPEWRFGITTGNKELREVGNTFLQLKLILDRGDGKTKEEYVELSLPQFYEFVATMEKAKAQMDFFS